MKYIAQSEHIILSGDEIMLDFYNMSDKEIIFLSAAVAAVIGEGLTADELNTLGAFITCIGDDLTAAATQKAVREARVQDLLLEAEEY